MTNRKIALLLGFVFFLVNALTLSQYGVSWDEPPNYLKADRFLEYFLTGNKDYLDLQKRMGVSAFDREENSLYTAQSFVFHPSVGSYLPAIFHKIFTQKLGILNHIDSHHLAIVLLSSILVSATYLLAFAGTKSKIIAFFSALLLMTFPRFLADAHFNPKDVPMTTFSVLFVLFFYNAVKEKKWWLVLISSVFAGLALGSKITGFPIIIVSLVWFVVFYGREAAKKSFSLPFLASLLSIFIVPPLILVGTWPQIWGNVFSNLKLAYRGATNVGLNGPDIWQTYATKYLILVTPTALLILFLIGIVWLIFKIFKEKEQREFLFLILLLLITPLLRVSMPRANPYDGIRQFFDVVPAMCVIGGIGAKALIEALQKIVQRFKPLYKIKSFNRSFTLALIVILIVLPILFEFAINFKKHHPYELTYFNPLFGGLPKAYYDKLPYSTDYWGGVYKQGVELLNEKLPKGATLDLPFGAHMIFDYNLRKDIRVCLTDLRGWSKVYPAPGDYIMYFTRQSSYSGNIIIEYCEERLNPIYTIDVDEVPILKVFKNSDEYKKE